MNTKKYINGPSEETLTPRENLMFAAAFILPKLDKLKRALVVEGRSAPFIPFG